MFYHLAEVISAVDWPTVAIYLVWIVTVTLFAKFIMDEQHEH